ncbi:MAG: hypothetical protein ACRECY_03920 [Phyllobacterium sp.]
MSWYVVNPVLPFSPSLDLRRRYRRLFAGCAAALLIGSPAWAQDRQQVPFSISVDGEPVAKSQSQLGPTRAAADRLGAPALQDRERKTDLRLNAVDIQVKFDGLDARPA